MVAQSVEQTIGIGGNSWRRKSDQRTYRRGSAFQRHLIEQIAIHVSVKDGGLLQQVLAGAFNRYALFRTFHLERDIQGDRNDRSNINVLGIGGKAWPVDFEMIRIERNIGDSEFPCAVGHDGPVESAHRVANFYIRIGNHCACRIDHRTGK